MTPLAPRFTIIALAIACLLVFPSAGAVARADDGAGTGSGSGTSASVVGHGKGVVVSVDEAAGTVTITHGPIKEFGWNGMTMAFGVQDRAWLPTLKKGDHLRFEAVQGDSGPTLTKMTKIP